MDLSNVANFITGLADVQKIVNIVTVGGVGSLATFGTIKIVAYLIDVLIKQNMTSLEKYAYNLGQKLATVSFKLVYKVAQKNQKNSYEIMLALSKFGDCIDAGWDDKINEMNLLYKTHQIIG